MVPITGTIKQERAQKMFGHGALQDRCLHTTNADRSKTLQQRPNCIVIHPS